VVGVVIGVGIFVNPSEVARLNPQPRAILLAWVLGGTAAILGGIALSKLGVWMPRAGGLYVYLREAYHPGVAFLYGWTVLLAVFSGVIAAVSLTFARYVVVLCPGLLGFERSLAVALVVALAGVNYRGVLLSRSIQNVLTLTKLAAVGLMVFLALRVVGPVGAPTGGSTDPGTFVFSLLPVLMSYGGWYTLTFVGGEISRPERSFRAGMVLGLAVVIGVYTLINAAYLNVLSVAEIAQSPAVAATMAGRLLGRPGENLVAALVALSAPGVVNVLILAGSRLYFAMAEDGLFFRQAARLHPRFKSPVYSIVAQSAWSAVLILSHSYQELLQDAMFAEWTFFSLTGAAVFVLAGRHSFEGAWDKALTSASAALFTLVATIVVLNTLLRSPRQSLQGLALMLAGFAAYWHFRARGGPR